MKQRKASFRKLIKLIEQSQNIVITTHLNPDGDGIGSQIGLMLALRKLKKKAYCVNEEDFPARYYYLDEKRQFVLNHKQLSKCAFPIDLFLIVDTNEDRIGENMIALRKKAKKYFYIDHHPLEKEKITKHHLIHTEAAATGELIAALIKELGVPYNQEIAMPLYTSIMIDTSSFRYPNVSSKTHHIIAELLETGIHPARVYDLIYGTKKIGNMQLLGEVLQRAKISDDKQIAWITITNEQLQQYQCKEEDTYSFVNYLLVLKDLKLAIMFRTHADGKGAKASFRSTGSIDVDKLAKKMGGGGHNYSAAVNFRGKTLELCQKKVIAEAKKYIKSLSDI